MRCNPNSISRSYVNKIHKKAQLRIVMDVPWSLGCLTTIRPQRPDNNVEQLNPYLDYGLLAFRGFDPPVRLMPVCFGWPRGLLGLLAGGSRWHPKYVVARGIYVNERKKCGTLRMRGASMMHNEPSRREKVRFGS